MLHSGFRSEDIFLENTKRFSNAGTGYASTDRKRADGQIIHEVADSVGYVLHGLGVSTFFLGAYFTLSNNLALLGICSLIWRAISSAIFTTSAFS